MTPKKRDEWRASYATAARKSFEELVRAIPTDIFLRMVGKSGLPAAEARELCLAFKELKR